MSIGDRSDIPLGIPVFATVSLRMSIQVLNGRSYSDHFDPKDFLNSFYASGESPNVKDIFDFYRQQLHNFYTKYSCKWNTKTARLLEFGGGPVIMPLINAAPYVDQITFAAYLESERKEIELWKHGKEGAHDWSLFFKHVVHKMEHTSGDNAWHEREELLRKRISSIIPCDIFSENPLLVKQEPFEIVNTSLCLESACTTYAEYKEGVKKLVGLLKPGGFLLMFIVERETFYIIGEKKWSCLYLTLEQMKEALTEAGTVVLVAERDPTPIEIIQNPVQSNQKAFVFVAAQKVEF